MLEIYSIRQMGGWLKLWQDKAEAKAKGIE
jgi:hypothetical protein